MVDVVDAEVDNTSPAQLQRSSYAKLPGQLAPASRFPVPGSRFRAERDDGQSPFQAEKTTDRRQCLGSELRHDFN